MRPALPTTNFIAALALLACSAACLAQNSTPSPTLALAPFSDSNSDTARPALHPAWRLSGLPAKFKVPIANFEVTGTGGEAVLQVSTDKSYGVLTHAWQGPAQPRPCWPGAGA